MSTVYVLTRQYDFERLFDQTAEAALQVLNSFRPKYLYVNPRYCIYSDTLTQQLVREIERSRVDWIRRTKTTFSRRNNRRISEWASPDARTKRDKWYEKSLCLNGLYFILGRPTNSQRWKNIAETALEIRVDVVRRSLQPVVCRAQPMNEEHPATTEKQDTICVRTRNIQERPLTAVQVKLDGGFDIDPFSETSSCDEPEQTLEDFFAETELIFGR